MCCTSTSSSRSSADVFEVALPVAAGNETLPCRAIVRVTPPPSLAAAIGAITAINAKQPIRAEMRDVRRMLFLRQVGDFGRQIARRRGRGRNGTLVLGPWRRSVAAGILVPCRRGFHAMMSRGGILRPVAVFALSGLAGAGAGRRSPARWALRSLATSRGAAPGQAGDHSDRPRHRRAGAHHRRRARRPAGDRPARPRSCAPACSRPAWPASRSGTPRARSSTPTSRG